MKQLLAAIQTGRAQGKRDEDIAEEIKKLPVPSDFVPRNPQDLSLYLTIILTLITLWLSRCDSSGAQSVINNDIQITIVNETLESMSQQGTEKSEQQIIWINDLTRESPTVAERSFHNVVIRGPAVVAFLDGCVLDDCTFDTGGSTDQRSLVWQSLNPKGGVGIVALKRCRFAQCRFVGIGVTGAQDDIEAFLRNVKVR